MGAGTSGIPVSQLITDSVLAGLNRVRIAGGRMSGTACSAVGLLYVSSEAAVCVFLGLVGTCDIVSPNVERGGVMLVIERAGRESRTRNQSPSVDQRFKRSSTQLYVDGIAVTHHTGVTRGSAIYLAGLKLAVAARKLGQRSNVDRRIDVPTRGDNNNSLALEPRPTCQDRSQ